MRLLVPLLTALLLQAPPSAPAPAPAPAPEPVSVSVSVSDRDRDRDGLDDALEDGLLQRFAPVVLLAPGEEALPSSAEWLLARATLEHPSARPPVLAASSVGALAALLGPRTQPGEHLRLHPGARGGSEDPADWTAYGHAYRAARGGVVLQYWLLYPFNDAYWAFDHDGDWEHVAVWLDAEGRPRGAWYAQHGDAMPGAWYPWSSLAREGERPVVHAARGTHASYPSPEATPRWEGTCPEGDPARAATAGCSVWRTAGGVRGVVNLGERAVPRVGFVAWPGAWGRNGGFGIRGVGPPPGPAFQPGWCSEGASGACP